jgi:hypothetical protein
LSVANIDTPLQLSEKVLIWEGPTDPLGNLPYINLLTKRGFVKKLVLRLQSERSQRYILMAA